uniref:Uncharacterized protein n=1 Tax=uncultured Micrococcales bacterium TaxID=1920814 RepID=A0A871Y6U2_9MICO|nr:hypothetical protein HULAa3G5_00027 [uncultured Micrococcales bacterium]
MIACAVLLVPFWLFDPIEILGVSRWEKPMKFFISTGIFCITYSWLSAHISRWPRLVYWTGVIIAISFIIEMIGIAGAAAFETTSHFNVSNPLSVAVWGIMATFVNIVFASTIVLSLLIVLERQKPMLMRVGLGLGSSITAVGMGIAFFMTGPTAEQLTNFQGIAGAHAVGVDDGGPGLPLLGWSTVAGDLRVGHFFGLHAIQIAIALLIIQRYLPAAMRMPLVTVGNLTYLGFVLIVTGQALRAETFINPSPETITQIMILFAVSISIFAFWSGLSSFRQRVRI